MSLVSLGLSTRFTMGFFSSLLGRRGPSPNVAMEISLDDYLYLFDYGMHYLGFLSGMSARARTIAELFLFRGWATQFGFRMFSTHPELSVSIMHETVNLLANTLVRAMLAAEYNVKFEQLYADDFTSLLHSRWQHYDGIFRESRTEKDRLAAFRICAASTEHCSARDPVKAMLLTADYLIPKKSKIAW